MYGRTSVTTGKLPDIRVRPFRIEGYGHAHLLEALAHLEQLLGT
jgi:hypothetical protein